MYIGLLNGAKELARTAGDWNSTVFFDNPNGFGLITHLALFEDEAGGNPVEIIELPEAVDCAPGAVPVVQNGRLIAAHAVSGACIDVINMDLNIDAH